MKKEGGFTLLELLVVLMIMGVAASIVVPSFSNSDEKLNEKLLYSQFDSVFQKASTDAAAESTPTVLVLVGDGYQVESPKANRKMKFLKNVEISSTDIGKQIEFNKKGQVLVPIDFMLVMENETFLFEVKEGYQNIIVNGEPLETIKGN